MAASAMAAAFVLQEGGARIRGRKTHKSSTDSNLYLVVGGQYHGGRPQFGGQAQDGSAHGLRRAFQVST